MRTSPILSCLLAAGCASVTGSSSDHELAPEQPFDRVRQREYVCYRAAESLSIDGRLDELAWRAAPPTEPFVDIEGPIRPDPPLETRARMLWDEEYFYIGAELEEPGVWANLTERDSVIFYDNDFEVFLDPDGDTQLYLELEINALGTEWDLLLVKAYRDGGPAVHAWDIPGLRSAVHVDGTLNDPTDTDRGWSVEIAIPWAGISEVAGRSVPPVEGDVWWAGYSRVEWETRVEGSEYVKVTDPATGKPLPEHNWVWSPQGVINMHRPETWGLVMFTEIAPGAGTVEFSPPENLVGRFALRRVYEAQRVFRERTGRYTTDVESLGLAGVEVSGWSWPPRIEVTGGYYEAILERGDGQALHQTSDGRLWVGGD